jgi:hypothetical protein
VARKAWEKAMKRIALPEIKDDLSKYLHLAKREEIIIIKHGKPAGTALTKRKLLRIAKAALVALGILILAAWLLNRGIESTIQRSLELEQRHLEHQREMEEYYKRIDKDNLQKRKDKEREPSRERISAP